MPASKIFQAKMKLNNPVYGVRSHDHLGDSIITTAAVHNVKLAHPEMRFKYIGWAPAIWENNPDIEKSDTQIDVELSCINYGGGLTEQLANRGTVINAFTQNLCEKVKVTAVPILTNIPFIVLTNKEKEKSKNWNNVILLNANGQRCSFSKCYPYWQEVVDELSKDFVIVQVGSNEKRNISPTLFNVIDYRGWSENIRDLLCMVYGCSGIISPPSAIIHIAAAFKKRAIVVNGARELDKLTDYPNMIHISHYYEPCDSGYNKACIALREFGSRSCQNITSYNGQHYAGCMKSINPERIIKAAKTLFKIDK